MTKERRLLGDAIAGQGITLLEYGRDHLDDEVDVTLGVDPSRDGQTDELARRRETYGISYVTVGDAQMEEFAPVVARLAGT